MSALYYRESGRIKETEAKVETPSESSRVFFAVVVSTYRRLPPNLWDTLDFVPASKQQPLAPYRHDARADLPQKLHTPQARKLSNRRRHWLGFDSTGRRMRLPVSLGCHPNPCLFSVYRGTAD